MWHCPEEITARGKILHREVGEKFRDLMGKGERKEKTRVPVVHWGS